MTADAGLCTGIWLKGTFPPSVSVSTGNALVISGEGCYGSQLTS